MAVRTALATLLIALLLPASARASGDWAWPVRGEVLTTFRNGSDPYAAGQHRGVDIAAPVGADVVAAVAGTVRHAGVAGDSGLTVSVRAGEHDVSYLHLSAVAVKEGQTVAAGTRLGAVGTSGRRSVAAPHLHLGVRRAGRAPRIPRPARLPGAAVRGPARGPARRSGARTRARRAPARTGAGARALTATRARRAAAPRPGGPARPRPGGPPRPGAPARPGAAGARAPGRPRARRRARARPTPGSLDPPPRAARPCPPGGPAPGPARRAGPFRVRQARTGS